MNEPDEIDGYFGRCEMFGIVALCVICTFGIAFLGCVFLAFCREDRYLMTKATSIKIVWQSAIRIPYKDSSLPQSRRTMPARNHSFTVVEGKQKRIGKPAGSARGIPISEETLPLVVCQSKRRAIVR